MKRGLCSLSLTAAICFFGVSVAAEDDPGALARIDALTTEKSTDLLIQFLADRADNCRVDIVYSEQKVILAAFLGSVLTSLQVPVEDQAAYYPALEGKLDSLEDADDIFEAKLDANFEVMSEDSEQMVLVVRNCEIAGS